MTNYKIHVNQMRPFPEGVFRVVVEGDPPSSRHGGATARQSKTEHAVSLREDYYEEMTRSTGSGQAGRKITPEDLIRKSFEFLLAREPKESILREFELPAIQKYFPEFEESIKGD